MTPEAKLADFACLAFARDQLAARQKIEMISSR